MTAIKVLGHIAIERDGETDAVAGRTLALLLSIFASRANRPVATETLVDALWSANARRGRATLQVHINRLREALGEGRPPAMLVTVPGGYRLDVAPSQLDIVELEDRVVRGIHAIRQGNPAGGARMVERALRSWAEPFGELADHPLLAAERTRLHELRHQGEEELCDAWLSVGRNRDAIERLARLTEEEPLRERRWGQRMLALYRAGRQAEALRCYQDIRRILGEELGVEPSPELRHLEEAILLHDQRLVLADRAGVVRPSNNLPPLRPIIGRHDAAVAVHRLLASSRLVTLIGAGGIGKTRLALSVAHRLLDDLPDGVHLVRLDGVGDGRLVPTAIADSLGILGADGTEVLDAITVNLGRRDIVIVLDNAEHVREATGRTVVALLERNPGARVLVTSRQPLHVEGEAVYRVPPLTVPAPSSAPADLAASPSVQLFLARAERPIADDVATLETVGAICREVGGSPLAIELAAARTSTMTPGDVLRRLESHLALLVDRRAAAEDRHRSVDASIAWSFSLLSADEQRLFSRLGVFRGGFSLASCLAVVVDADLEERRVIELLDRLVDASLLAVGDVGRETWFTLAATLGEYGRARLDEAGARERFERRHRDHCVDLAFGASRNIVKHADTVIPMVHAQHHNIRAALRWSIDRGDITEAIELGGAMSIFWNIHGYIREGRRWLDEIRALGTPSSPMSEGRLAQASAQLAASDVDYAHADEWFALADARYTAGGLDVLGAWSRFWWARTLVARAFLGRGEASLLDRADLLYASGCEVFRERHDWAGLMSVLPFGAVVHIVRGADGAQAMIDEAAGIADVLGVERGRAIADVSLAMECLRRGDPAGAVTAGSRAAPILGRLGDRHNEMQALSMVSLGAARLGDADAARAVARDVLRLHRRYGNREYAPFVLAVGWYALAVSRRSAAHGAREALDLMHPWWSTPLLVLGIDRAPARVLDRAGHVPLRWPSWTAAHERVLDALSR